MNQLEKLKNNMVNLSWWLLILLLVWLWLHFFLFGNASDDSFEPIANPSQNNSNQLSQSRISSYHLFGSSSITETSLNLGQFESSLDLVITGIMSSNDPHSGMAYIKSSQNLQKKFKVGDEVFGLATIKEIYSDYLILDHNNKSEKLSLFKGRKLSTINNKRNKPRGKDNTLSKSQMSSHINTGDMNWQEMMKKQQFDPQKIANIVGNVSVVHNNLGQISGLRVSSLSENNALIKQGLRPNDQIVAINDVAISAANILTIRSQLENSNQVGVTVMRNGRKINLSVNLSEIKQ
ncbi:MAG: PDZ domain-containing protein [Proteobacteria bacterium]|nr:PDZ domain-containing protein [Pseudomonadota bacterium]